MNMLSGNTRRLALAAALAFPAWGSASAQTEIPEPGVTGRVTDTSPAATMTEGPEIEGMISARSADRIQITQDDGMKSVVTLTSATEIQSSGGFLSLDRDKLAAASLVNGLPVTVKTMQAGDELLASKISLKKKDLKTAAMIHNGTAQGFAEQTAATDALRSRMGDIDKYNVKSTTDVNFGTGKYALTEQAKADLCATAAQADAMDNALLLVVGYTDSTGSEEYNQVLSEKRASRVVNHLQQACHWKPYRMLTPTGMSEADPLASNDTAEGKAQNRRVTVNVLVSKAVDGI